MSYSISPPMGLRTVMTAITVLGLHRLTRCNAEWCQTWSENAFLAALKRVDEANDELREAVIAANKGWRQHPRNRQGRREDHPNRAEVAPGKDER